MLVPSWRITAGVVWNPPTMASNVVGRWRPSGSTVSSSGSSKLMTNVRCRDGSPMCSPGSNPA